MRDDKEAEIIHQTISQKFKTISEILKLFQEHDPVDPASDPISD